MAQLAPDPVGEAVSALDSLAMFGRLHPTLVIAVYGCGDGTADARVLGDLLRPIMTHPDWIGPSGIQVSAVFTPAEFCSAAQHLPTAACTLSHFMRTRYGFVQLMSPLSPLSAARDERVQ